MNRRYIIVLFALVAAVIAMFCSHDRKRYFSHEGVVWTTDYHITYEASRDLGDSIQRILGDLDKCVSPYNKASLITAINRNATAQTDRYLRLLLQASRAVNRESGGAFDPTVMPLVNAWGFGYKNGDLPTRARLDSILQFVGMDKIELLPDNTINKKDPRVMLDFSSIAKGLACDEIGRMLQRNGACNWLVEIGGEVAACGVNSRGTPRWTCPTTARIPSVTGVRWCSRSTTVPSRPAATTASGAWNRVTNCRTSLTHARATAVQAPC